jgi:hypothetical protein
MSDAPGPAHMARPSTQHQCHLGYSFSILHGVSTEAARLHLLPLQELLQSGCVRCRPLSHHGAAMPRAGPLWRRSRPRLGQPPGRELARGYGLCRHFEFRSSRVGHGTTLGWRSNAGDARSGSVQARCSWPRNVVVAIQPMNRLIGRVSRKRPGSTQRRALWTSPPTSETRCASGRSTCLEDSAGAIASAVLASSRRTRAKSAVGCQLHPGEVAPPPWLTTNAVRNAFPPDLAQPNGSRRQNAGLSKLAVGVADEGGPSNVSSVRAKAASASPKKRSPRPETRAASTGAAGSASTATSTLVS